MHPKFLIILLIVLLCGLFALWDVIGDPVAIMLRKNPQITELSVTVKPFTFTTLEGKRIQSEDLKGKVVVLNFWASWCVPCTVEFPDLIKFTQNYPDDVIFLALSVDETLNNASRFVSRFKDTPQTNRIIGLDKDKKIAHDHFQTTMYPETYILDRNFTIRRHIVGVIDWAADDIRIDLERLIAERPQKK